MSSAICAKKLLSSLVKTSWRTKYPFWFHCENSSALSLNVGSSGIVCMFTNSFVKTSPFFKGVLTGGSLPALPKIG